MRYRVRGIGYEVWGMRCGVWGTRWCNADSGEALVSIKLTQDSEGE